MMKLIQPHTRVLVDHTVYLVRGQLLEQGFVQLDFTVLLVQLSQLKLLLEHSPLLQAQYHQSIATLDFSHFDLKVRLVSSVQMAINAKELVLHGLLYVLLGFIDRVGLQTFVRHVQKARFLLIEGLKIVQNVMYVLKEEFVIIMVFTISVSQLFVNQAMCVEKAQVKD